MINPFTFIETKEYRRFTEFCDACAKYRFIGVCHGLPGIGKTVAARQYANWDFIEPNITKPTLLYEKGEHLTNDSILDARTLFVTAPTVRPSVLSSQLQNLGRDLLWTQEGYKGKKDGKSKEEKHELFSSAIRKGAFYSVDLIIVDEIDRLKLQTLEILRDIYDQNDVGMVFIGMQGIEKRLSRYPQLYSRVGFSHEFKKLTPTEMHHILEYKWKEVGLSVSYEDFEDYDAVNRIIKLSNGNFRLVQRIFTQIDRIMEINNLDKITTEVIDTARDSLVIGFTE
ncbi:MULTISPECIES: AAA family ATPase [Bacillus cereus group]|uniref:AAA family ATPase n=1 Tax=Bacillus cereus group TaxID=86661 RepID=UPI0018CE1811|nr:AAA family ATPase [Bacillus thuringiensis]MDA2639283.1 AAA family ATPase [Bacillus cereus]MBG9519613.1 ATP-binding protein [Bacillus thuringiensis]MBG9519622.1 ATP-binding protein [Bacillus thuringiensis]MBG9520310.1 ATP-binding protein [Bacillus thuringiensis]MBG9522387.1 ATP-binding protein [Bacillus thuringiensis]